MTETVTHAGLSKTLIGRLVTLNVSYSPQYQHEDFSELEISSRLVGVLDVFADDGETVEASTWVFTEPVGQVLVEWKKNRLSGNAVSKIRSVEISEVIV